MLYKKVEVSGASINRFINMLVTNNIEITSLKKHDITSVMFDITNKYYKKMCKLAKICNLKVRIVENKSYSYYLKLVLSNIGFTFGIIVVFAFFVVVNNYTIDVIINCNQNSLKLQAEQLLKENGIYKYSKKQNLTNHEIENLIMQNLQDSAVVNVSQKGNKVYVNIKSAVQKNIIESGIIIAKYSGVITEINYKSGVLCCNVGESVVAGDKLILDGKIGDVYTGASGDVFAKVIISGSASQSLTTIKEVESGNTKECSYLQLFGKRWYISKNTEQEADRFFNLYTKQYTEVKLFNGFLLPIKKITIKYAELIEQEVKNEYNNVVESLKQSAYKIAISNMPNGTSAEDVSYNIVQKGEQINVTCNITTICSIAERQQIQKEDN